MTEEIADCFQRREPRAVVREMTEAMLMELDTRNCWTLAEALGHSRPHRLQHLLSRAAVDHDLARDRIAAWTAGELADPDAVLIVDETGDETGDEKSSTDCVGAARQYSGALGGIGLCQVAVHLTYAGRHGHALIDRALYLGAEWAADEERRLLTHVPDDVVFATKPQLAGAPLARTRDLGIPARWLAGDEVYGGKELRRTARALGFDYALAVRTDHRVDTAIGRLTVTGLATRVPKKNWMRLRTGHGLKGDRHYDWAMLDIHPDDTHDGHRPGHATVLVRRHRYTRELSFYRCHSATPDATATTACTGPPGAATTSIKPPKPTADGTTSPPLQRPDQPRCPADQGTTAAVSVVPGPPRHHEREGPDRPGPVRRGCRRLGRGRRCGPSRRPRRRAGGTGASTGRGGRCR
ncbi:IS701 family transposase [Streptomyces pratens]|uniref:IS701 family transposase n=1 Tax=Streptomyces pratens TaxID=887456 RepID=A0ABW1LUB0_9ACTN